MSNTDEKRYIKLTDSDILSPADPNAIPDMLDGCGIHKAMHHIRVNIAEKQDELIMDAIQRIGGNTYEDITLDKSKVLEALGKYIPKRVVAKHTEDINYDRCPTCGCKVRSFTLRYTGPESYCVSCGQHLDWSDISKGSDENS